MGPPAGWLGGFVPMRLVLARTPARVVTISGMAAYDTGVEFVMRFRSREPFGGPGGLLGFLGWEPKARFGVVYPDGSSWEATGNDRDESRLLDEPARPNVHLVGGGGDGLGYRLNAWMWPLPPPGPVRFELTWPDEGIDGAVAELDGQLFRDAATTALHLWEPLTGDERTALMRERFGEGVGPLDEAPDPVDD
jgi:hypothetical protein